MMRLLANSVVGHNVTRFLSALALIALVVTIPGPIAFAPAGVADAQSDSPLFTELERQYVDPIYGYSISYSSTWYLRPTASAGGLASFSPFPLTADFLSAENGLPQGYVRVEVGVWPYQYSGHSEQLLPWLEGQLLPYSTTGQVDSISLGNAEAWLIERIGSDGSRVLLCIAEKSGVVYVAAMYGAVDEYLDVFRAMLETLTLPDTPQATVQDGGALLAYPPGVPNHGDPVNYFSLDAIAKYSLPFGAHYPGGTSWTISQTGDGGESHHCPATLVGDSNCGAIDFSLPCGTPIYAAYGGVVTHTGWDPNAHGFGLYIIILNDGSSTYSLYAHLSSRIGTITVGTHVQQGQQLGLSGDTGGWPCHLHFGISLRAYEWEYGYVYLPVNLEQYPGLVWNNPADPDSGCTGYDCGDALGVPEVFPDRNFQGEPQAFGSMATDLTSERIGNDNIESLRLPNEYSIYLYLHSADQGWGPYANFTGYQETEIPNLDGRVVEGNQASALLAYRTAVCSPTGRLRNLRSPGAVSQSAIWSTTCPSPPSPSSDSATFTGWEDPPDYVVVSPGQALHKVWRVRNTGTSTWGSGYQLVFIGGDQMGAPASVSVPSTAPGATADLVVDMTAPSTAGVYEGHWRLRNAQGTYFGDELWVIVTVSGDTPPSGDEIDLSCEYCPPVVTPGEQFQPIIRATVNSGQLLGSRGDMLRNTDGNLYGAWPHVAVVGSVNPGQTYDFVFYADNPITAPETEGTYETRWRVWRNGDWAGSEITIRFEVQSPANLNHPPNAPTLTGPGDWAIFQGTPVVLTAQHNGDPDGDAITGYYFDLLGPNPRNSGWIGSNSWSPEGLPYSNYEWRVRVRDSRGAESDWSPQLWHFNVLNNEPEIYDFHWEWCRDAWGGPEKICFCASTNAGTLQVMMNTAADGSDDGEWHVVNELGVPEYRCQNDSDRPPNTNNLEWATGTHLARLYARREGGWENAAYRDITISLAAERRPNDPSGRQPPSEAYVGSQTVYFDWIDTLRTTDYRLEVSTDPSYATWLVDQHFPVGTSEYTHTFSSDYETVYWRVTATGPYGTNGGTGSGNHFHIDITPPDSAVIALPAVTTDTSFAVSWGGSDARSGLRWYDIQFRDGERGEWVGWMAQTTLTSAIFRGETGHIYYFRCRAMDEVGNWEGYPSGDGDTYTLIDPTAAPPTPWWNSGYSLRRNVIVLNNDGHTMPVHYPVGLHFDSSTTPSSEEMYNASQSAVRGNDFRIVYNNVTELDRHVQNFSPTQIDIWFPLQADLAGYQSSPDSYQLYYGNPTATNPPADVNDVYLPVADANTIGLWHFQDGSGSTVLDTSGHNHNGTFYSPAWAAGFLGTTGSFNGSSSYVDVGNASEFNLSTEPMTLEAWIYVTSENYGNIISKWSAAGGRSYWLRLLGGHSLHFLMDGGGEVSTGAIIELNQWYHVAAVYDGTSTMSIYVNGSRRANRSDVHDGLLSSTPVNIGREGDGGYFPGYIQHVRISNVARTDFPYALVTTSPSVQVGGSVSQPISGIPDLGVQSVAVYPTSSAGILVEAVVYNAGDAPTINGFYTDLYADHIPTGAGDYTGSVRFWVNTHIETGDTVTLTTVITELPGLRGLASRGGAIAAESDGTLYVQVDSTGAVSETNNANNISSGIGVCIAAADAYEDDDTPATAQPIAIGETQHHNFDSLGDQDWVEFTAQAGVAYTIWTSGLGPAADTYLYLYDGGWHHLDDDHAGSRNPQFHGSENGVLVNSMPFVPVNVTGDEPEGNARPSLSSPAPLALGEPEAPGDPDAILWDQPLSTVNQGAHVDQDFPDFPTYSSFLADDFVNANPWGISTIFVPGNGWNGFSSLLNADSLTWQIYADCAGVPCGDPSGAGSPPLWTLTLAPTDPRVVISTGAPGGYPSNTTLNLPSLVTVPPGHWWLIFYPTMSFGSYGQFGRQPADTTNGYTGQFVNPGGGFGYGTSWQPWTVIGATQTDIAFHIDGSTLLAANDDYSGTLASLIEWTAPTTGTYYLAVEHWNPNAAGCGTGYGLTVMEGMILAAPTASAAVSGDNDLLLSWLAVPNATSYNVYRSVNDPYFTPGAPYTTTTNTSMIDAGVLGDFDNSYFYLVRSANARGESPDSNRVGTMSFALVRGANNTIPFPLADGCLVTADDLGAAVGATVVSRWVASTQSMDSRIVGLAGENFLLSTGAAYFVYTTEGGPAMFTTVGGVPAAGSVQFAIERDATCRLNLLTLPLDQAGIVTADELATAIGGVPVISEWLAATGGFDSRIVGMVGNNFITRIGYPYWPCADTSGGGTTWP